MNIRESTSQALDKVQSVSGRLTVTGIIGDAIFNKVSAPVVDSLFSGMWMIGGPVFALSRLSRQALKTSNKVSTGGAR